MGLFQDFTFMILTSVTYVAYMMIIMVIVWLTSEERDKGDKVKNDRET